MDTFSINNQTVYQIASFMVLLDKTAFEHQFQSEAKILLDSLQTAWKAYILTKAQFSSGESLINIIDHYHKALIEITEAIYKVLNQKNETAIIRSSCLEKYQQLCKFFVPHL